MGCSSSALHKAQDSSRRRCEESVSSTAQPKPPLVAREPNYCDPVRRAHLSPLDKFQVSATSVANGLGAHPGQPLRQGAVDTPTPGAAEEGPAQPGSKGEAASEAAGEAWTETRSEEGDPEAVGSEAQGPPRGPVSELECPAAEEGSQDPQLPTAVPPGGAGTVPTEAGAPGERPDTPPEETAPAEMWAAASPQGTPDPHSPELASPAGVDTGRPAGILETGAGVDTVSRRSAHNEDSQDGEGETGEEVEAETAGEQVSRGAETKEEETGEAVGVAASEGGDPRSRCGGAFQPLRA